MSPGPDNPYRGSASARLHSGARLVCKLGQPKRPYDRQDIQRAIELGINWIDTAPVYGNGHAEEVIGRALMALPDADRLLVCTKGGLEWDDNRPLADPVRVGSPDRLRKGVFASLRRLRRDHLDLYQVHWPPQDGTGIEDLWSTMLDLRREGWVRAVGVSNYDVSQLNASRLVDPVQSVQFHLNLLHRDRLADVLPWCLATKIPALVFAAFQHGLLTQSMTPERLRRLPSNDWRTKLPDFATGQRDVNLAFIKALTGVASNQGISIIQLAIAWALAVPGVTGVILGSRSPEQVDSWRPALDVRLSAEALIEIAAITKDLDAGTRPSLI